MGAKCPGCDGTDIELVFSPRLDNSYWRMRCKVCGRESDDFTAQSGALKVWKVKFMGPGEFKVNGEYHDAAGRVWSVEQCYKDVMLVRLQYDNGIEVEREYNLAVLDTDTTATVILSPHHTVILKAKEEEE